MDQLHQAVEKKNHVFQMQLDREELKVTTGERALEVNLKRFIVLFYPT